MVPVVAVATAVVVTVNVAVDDPAGIVTVDGSVAELLLLESATVTAEGEVAFSVTVPVTPDPPSTDVGESVRL